MAAVAVSDQDTKDAWAFAQAYRRDNTLVTGVARVLGKSDAEIDALFGMAAAL